MHSRKLTSGCQWGLSTVGHFWSHCQLCTHALGYAGKSLTAGHWGFVQRVLWLRWSTLPKAVGGQLQVANREVAGEWDLESWATQEGYRMFLFWKCSYLRGFPCSWHWVQLCENIRHARNICFCLLTPPLIKILIKQIQYSGWEGRIYSMSVWVFVSCTSNCTMLSICKCFHQEGSITHNVLSPATQRQWQ